MNQPVDTKAILNLYWGNGMERVFKKYKKFVLKICVYPDTCQIKGGKYQKEKNKRKKTTTTAKPTKL